MPLLFTLTSLLNPKPSNKICPSPSATPEKQCGEKPETIAYALKEVGFRVSGLRFGVSGVGQGNLKTIGVSGLIWDFHSFQRFSGCFGVLS